MKKAVKIGMLVAGLMGGISALSHIHNAEVCKVYSERYVEGFDNGEKYGRMDGRIDVLYELCKDGMITTDTYTKYVNEYFYK